MKHIGDETHLSTLESIVAVAAFVIAIVSLFVAFTWATAKPN